MMTEEERGVRAEEVVRHGLFEAMEVSRETAPDREYIRKVGRHIIGLDCLGKMGATPLVALDRQLELMAQYYDLHRHLVDIAEAMTEVVEEVWFVAFRP